ncbi:MAG: hypothetical protein EZS28_043916 [Streblomastix strix]|uniref:Uncharacterized protein n=1 Tax=Streblomastix strix TaxID=222440 RepID=A0A5J4TQL5_9EUKA|nr:MAG: hypothetical protein EZS28_043916 [Streblomastix strix]
MSISPRLQSLSLTLEETELILNTVSVWEPRGHKERGSESKQSKLLQCTGLMDAVGKFHEAMKLTICEERKKPKVQFPRQQRDYTNKVVTPFFFAPKNYNPTQISRPSDLVFSEEKFQKFDWYQYKNVVSFCP